MSGLPMTFACGLYDRMLALQTGEIKPDGIDLNFLVMDNPREIFDRMSNRLEFDACEMSSSELISRHAANKLPFVAIPVFASRVFRHGFITVNRNHVKKPKDLEGKRVGVPLYTQTAALFVRGLMQHDLGIDLSTIEWIEGAVNEPGSYGNPSVMPLLEEDQSQAEQERQIAQRPLGRRRDPGTDRVQHAELAQDQPRCGAAYSRLPGAGEGLLQAHQNLPDHAHHRHPAGSV